LLLNKGTKEEEEEEEEKDLNIVFLHQDFLCLLA